MKEFVLHYIWQQKLFYSQEQKTVTGEAVEILDVGKPHTDEGPDFFNAKIKIGDTLWAGNVEIHTRSSDWYKHQHHQNPAYDNVILHVVRVADAEVFLSKGNPLPQMVLNFPASIEKNIVALMESTLRIPCEDKVQNLSPTLLLSWKDTLFAERLMLKVSEIEQMLQKNNRFWEETLYHFLCRGFGFSVNNEAFCRLAGSIEWSVVQKCRHNRFQLEALFLGQSGWLSKMELNDDFTHRLLNEYAFLVKKFGLTTQDLPWKMLRLRPDNFPHVRLSQLATLIHSNHQLFSCVTSLMSVDGWLKLFKVQPLDYWDTHDYRGRSVKARQRSLSKPSAYSLLINVIVPMLFTYGLQMQRDDMKEKALQIMNELPAEDNHVIRSWKSRGMNIRSAYDSQALMQLTRKYCEEKKCLRCRIGHKVLTANTVENI